MVSVFLENAVANGWYCCIALDSHGGLMQEGSTKLFLTVTLNFVGHIHRESGKKGVSIGNIKVKQVLSRLKMKRDALGKDICKTPG